MHGFLACLKIRAYCFDTESLVWHCPNLSKRERERERDRQTEGKREREEGERERRERERRKRDRERERGGRERERHVLYGFHGFHNVVNNCGLIGLPVQNLVGIILMVSWPALKYYPAWYSLMETLCCTLTSL